MSDPARLREERLGNISGNFLILELSVSLKSHELFKSKVRNLDKDFQSSGMDLIR